MTIKGNFKTDQRKGQSCPNEPNKQTIIIVKYDVDESKSRLNERPLTHSLCFYKILLSETTEPDGHNQGTEPDITFDEPPMAEATPVDDHGFQTHSSTNYYAVPPSSYNPTYVQGFNNNNAPSSAKPPQASVVTPFSQSLSPESNTAPQPSSTTTTNTQQQYTVPTATPYPAAQTAPTPPASSFPGRLGRHPVNMTCPYCRQAAMTRARTHIDCVTILMVIVIIFIFWPLFFLPLIIPGCKTTTHVSARPLISMDNHFLNFKIRVSPIRFSCSVKSTVKSATEKLVP